MLRIKVTVDMEMPNGDKTFVEVPLTEEDVRGLAVEKAKKDYEAISYSTSDVWVTTGISP